MFGYYIGSHKKNLSDGAFNPEDIESIWKKLKEEMVKVATNSNLENFKKRNSSVIETEPNKKKSKLVADEDQEKEQKPD